MRHDAAFVELLSRETGLSRRTIKHGLDDLIGAGLIVRDPRGGYIGIMKDEPSADQAEGPITSQRGQDER